MKTRILFRWIAPALLAMSAATAGSAGDPACLSDHARIVDLPAITVNPSALDVAYFRAHRIVDLPRVTVRPEAADLAVFLADNTARIVQSPLVLPQASVVERRMATASFDALAMR